MKRPNIIEILYVSGASDELIKEEKKYFRRAITLFSIGVLGLGIGIGATLAELPWLREAAYVTAGVCLSISLLSGYKSTQIGDKNIRMMKDFMDRLKIIRNSYEDDD